MAAKLLHSLADDNPDLQKQIGCMNGIFNLFDRTQIVSSRRLSHNRLSSGRSQFNVNRESSSASYNQHRQTQTISKRNSSETQRIFTESSSRPSISSSCTSSVSSSEFNRAPPPEASFNRVIFPETPSRDGGFQHVGRQSLDLRDVVKDSMYREARGLTVKTTIKDEKTVSRSVKLRDSPRLLQLSRSMNESRSSTIRGKQNIHVDVKAPRYYSEGVELPRSSYEAMVEQPRMEAPRYSYDERDLSRSSFESRDTFRSLSKLKQSPRLSLDSSREGLVWGSDLETNTSLKSFQSYSDSSKEAPPVQLSEKSGSQKRSAGVVAKLMGLETLPHSGSSNHRDNRLGFVDAYPVEDVCLFSRSLNRDYVRTRRKSSDLIMNSKYNEPMSPRRKSSDLIMKPISSSRIPIEPAPWKQLNGNRGSQKSAAAASNPVKHSDSFPSIVNEIEKRLADIEFKQSGTDLRALKQILEAMQAKGFLETKPEDQRYYEPNRLVPNHDSRSQQRRSSNHVASLTTRKNYESPIVIMKPAKLVEKSGIPSSSVVPVDKVSGLYKLPSRGSIDCKKSSTNYRMAKDRSPRISGSDSSISSTDIKSKNTRSAESMRKTSKESTTATSVKSSGSISPRLQQKKHDRPPTPPPSDSSKSRRQPNKQPTEATSPGGKRRPKTHNIPKNDDQMSQISNDSKASSQQGDDTSVQSDSGSHDPKICSVDPTIDISYIPSPSVNVVTYSRSMHKELERVLSEDESAAETTTLVASEHPSPVSVLDTSAYIEDAASSPANQIPNNSEGDDTRYTINNRIEHQWNPADNFSTNITVGLTSEINRKKLEDIEHLVQKLRRLNSSHDEANTDYIASLCENSTPDQRYISEILLASGLLLRDLSSGLESFQLHQTGHPINPELFFVLEQTKSSSNNTLLSKDPTKLSHSKPDHEKLHRKLVFDVVNEILVKKLTLVAGCNKLAKNTLNAQKLLKELSSEIEQLETKKSSSDLEEEEKDGLRDMLWEDVMNRSGSWTDFRCDMSGAVLDIERLVFKDLVDEIVINESVGLRRRSGSKRQLFAKK